ncbi:MAG: T9SS type A sorting domain-containing protein [Salibacteraceae bacterium]
MKKVLIPLMGTFLIAGTWVLTSGEESPTPKAVSEARFVEQSHEEGLHAREGRWAYELERIKDPSTGKLPDNVRQRELAFAATLPQNQVGSSARSEKFPWTLLGPSNVGGRTRAFGIDVNNENTYLAGGVSGGIWRSTDRGQTWQKATAPDQHHSITCLSQDRRPGKTDTWYYASGELRGNSASRSFSAYYLGNGVYKSTDNGQSWAPLSSTVSGTPQATDAFDRAWNIATDPSDLNNDVVFVAMANEIRRSEDGGQTWTTVLGSSSGLTASFYTDITVTETGVCYATLSSGGQQRGIWRSIDGINWINITPAGFPSNYERIVMGVDPSDENRIYFLGETPGTGAPVNPNSGNTDYHSLWKYTYLTGDGSGTNGQWDNLTATIPSTQSSRTTFTSQGSYDIVVAVKPDDPNVVFIGGTNLFRSTDGFTSDTQITQIGGYLPGVSGPWGYRWENHHPDQHLIAFQPSNPDVLISINDGGLYQTANCLDSLPTWKSISKGYVTSQFYTVAIDHGQDLNLTVMGGLQDNGTQWTNSTDPNFDWVSPNLGDGSHCAIADNGTMYYSSRQYGRILKAELNSQGEKTGYTRIDPDQIPGGYLFVHPFILDPRDNDIMYLPNGPELWRNNDLSQLGLDDLYEKQTTNWVQMTNATTSNIITTLAASYEPAHRLYVGQSNRRIYRIDDAHTGNPTSVDITNNINSGTYTSDIAIDPRNADNVMVVYSNYNVYSIWYSEDGGNNWTGVAGNLEDPNPPTGAPPGFGDGPSVRCAAIIPVEDNQTVFMVGTSTGLYATAQLQGDSTVWHQQGPNTIGNVVVDAIDSRQWDGFTAIATHGNGVFTSFITDVDGVTNLDEWTAWDQGLRVFPNPARDVITIEGTEKASQVEIRDVQGKLVFSHAIRSNGTSPWRETIAVDQLPKGVYFCVLPEAGTVQKLVVSE